MKFQKISVIFFCGLFFSCTAILSFQKKAVSVNLGSEWGPGIFAENVDINRLIPIISYMRVDALRNIAKIVASRKDIKTILDQFDESAFKMEIRRQFYLLNYGERLDDALINFSIKELLQAGMLEQKISDAGQSGLLDLSGMQISGLYGLEDVLAKIKGTIDSLDLSHNLLTAISASDFVSVYLFRLRNLDFSFNQIVLLQDNCFENLSNVEFLDLGNNKILFLPNHIFAGLKNLERLDLSDNKFISLESIIFVGLKKLRMLNLADNPTKNLGVIKENIKEFNPDVEIYRNYSGSDK